MFFQHKQYHSFTLLFLRIALNITTSMSFLFIIDIFFLKEASQFHRICFVATDLLRGAMRRGNLMSLRKHYEVTTLSAIVRDELHPPRLASTAILTRE